MLKLSPPWYTYHRKLAAMFSGDPEIQVRDLADDGQGTFTVMFLIHSEKKAAALKNLLISPVVMGDIRINLTILGPNENSLEQDSHDTAQLYNDALSGNTAFIQIISNGLPQFPQTYCILAKKVVQFYNDDLSDYYQNWNGLYENIADEIFNLKAYPIAFCTDIT